QITDGHTGPAEPDRPQRGAPGEPASPVPHRRVLHAQTLGHPPHADTPRTSSRPPPRSPRPHQGGPRSRTRAARREFAHNNGLGAPTDGGSPRRSPERRAHTNPKTASAGGIPDSPAAAPPPRGRPQRTHRHPARLAIRSPSAHSPSGPLPMSDQLR